MRECLYEESESMSFFRSTFREAIQDFWVHRKKNHPGTLVMNLDTYRCGHEQT